MGRKKGRVNDWPAWSNDGLQEWRLEWNGIPQQFKIHGHLAVQRSTRLRPLCQLPHCQADRYRDLGRKHTLPPLILSSSTLLLLKMSVTKLPSVLKERISLQMIQFTSIHSIVRNTSCDLTIQPYLSLTNSHHEDFVYRLLCLPLCYSPCIPCPWSRCPRRPS